MTKVFERKYRVMQSIRYYGPGIILISIAIMIVAVPEILVAFAASIIIMAGIGALYIGHKMRKSEIEFRDTDTQFFDDDFFGRMIFRRPVFRRSNRDYW